MLPPEYKRALDVLLASLTEILRSSRLKFDKYLLYSGEIQIVEGRITPKDIPKGDVWRWNQTKSRQVVVLNGGNLVIRFAKLTPRHTSKRMTSQLPSFKIWHFNITYPSAPQKEYNAIYCERGYSKYTLDNTIPTHIPHPELNIDEFSFLAKFLPQETVDEFWPGILNETSNTLFNNPLPCL